MNPSEMTDGQLDAAFGAYFNSGHVKEATPYAVEIIARLASVWSFATGALGYVRFPLYDASKGTFKQAETAQRSVATSASNVANSVSFWGGSFMIVLALVAVAVILVKVKK